MDDINNIYLNAYEIRIDTSFIKDLTLMEDILFQCKCVLFLFDVTKKESFKLIKDLLNVIKLEKFSYLKGILVLNKLDLINRKVTEFEIKEYLENNKYLDFQEISIKNGENLKILLNKIYIYLNKSILSVNLISRIFRKKTNVNFAYNFNITLLGCSCVGKTCFFTRFLRNEYKEQMGTIGMDKEIKTIKFANYIYKLSVLNSTGAERFYCLTKKYL